MTKTDLVSAVAEKACVTKKDAGAVLDALIDEIIGAVKKGDRVQLVGFGTFELRERAARTGLNPADQRADRNSGVQSARFQSRQGI